MEHLLFEARMALLCAQGDLRWARRYSKFVSLYEAKFLAALDRVWAVQCMLNPSLS
jgi:hypothetical protein